MKKFFASIGRFLKNNYWLQPLILVAIVFILVFSLQGFQGTVDTIKGWFSPNSTCKQCEKVKVDETNKYLSEISDDEVIYVLYYSKDCEACTTANGALNLFIKSYNKDQSAAGKDEVTVYAVNYGVKEYYEVNTDEPKKFYDKNMTVEAYEQISEDVRVYLAESNPETVTGKNPYTYLISTPTLVRYVKGATSYEVDNVLFSDEDANVSNYFNQANLKAFFNGTYTR